ncbi:MAG: tRNA 2-selenouridine(34) synthase MnmH [Candidatus Puniceispirillum sp.]|nr:tRNA 2-selenouridine(34) synthase MnmH [Candidatus Puniceispirillum sp.]
MGTPIKRITEWWHIDNFDSTIDVRTPAEFADDHLPGAINLPVFTNQQRIDIGTMYKQTGSFEAKRAGAALVARNIATHLQDSLADKPRDWRPLVYCWRGGQRSGAMAQILSDIGWHVKLIDGGYKRYRRDVLAKLETIPQTLRVIKVGGVTGTAKTHILKAARDLGAQVIDLEGLAKHRGSLLGIEPDADQPAQRLFESEIAYCLDQFDCARPVFVEAESNKIGQLHIPADLFAKMRTAKTVLITASLSARVAFLKRDYHHMTSQPERLLPLFDGLVKRYGHETVKGWKTLSSVGNWDALVSDLLETHYDPAYTRSARAHGHDVIMTIDGGALDNTAIQKAATQLLTIS